MATDGRTYTMPIRIAEAEATRQIIEAKFGEGKTANKRWLVCGDLNDYRSRIVIEGSRHSGFRFQPATEEYCGHDALLRDEFSVNLVERKACDGSVDLVSFSWAARTAFVPARLSSGFSRPCSKQPKGCAGHYSKRPALSYSIS